MPPLFDGTNYAYQKVRMRAFLQSLDEKVWQAVEIGWTKPKEASADWDDAKIKVANFNSKALNALFSAVTNEEFKKISSTKIAKEAWTILQTTYEGAKAIKDSKFQRLTTSFEEIKMEEDEPFDELYAKLKDIVNSVFNLGETIPEPKILRKVLISLPKRFHAKITTIEESKDIDKIPLIELVGNLQTYELDLTRIGKLGKGKSMTLKAKSSDIDESSDDKDFKMKSYIIRQFKKFMKNANGKGFDKDFRQSSSSQFKSQDKGKKDARDGSRYTIPSGPKCKALTATLSDTVNLTKGIVEDVDEEKELMESKFEKMDEQDDIYIAYAKLYKVSEKHEKMYRLASKKLSDVELD